MTEIDPEFFEERAGIREYEGGQSREEAEEGARLDWRNTLDRDAERAKREIREMTTTARRSIGQRWHHIRDEVRRALA